MAKNRENPANVDDDQPVTVRDIKNLLGGLPKVVERYVTDFLEKYTKPIIYIGQLIGIDISQEERKPEDVLGGYKNVAEAISDLRKRLGDAEEKLRKYENATPSLHIDGDLKNLLEGDQGLIERVRKLEERPASDGKKGRKEDPKTGEELRAIREVLVGLVKEVYQGEPSMQRYLKILDGDKKA